MIHAKVKRWGNSPAVRIPITLMQALDLHIDDEISLHLMEGKLVIESIKRENPVYSLSDLVEKITPENMNEWVDWGEPVGKETW